MFDVAVGDRRDCEGVELACFAVHARSSSWISRDAELRHLYHDTTTWSEELLPACCERDGALYTSTLRLTRALALAWQPISGERRIAKLVNPATGLTADNIAWTGAPRAARGDAMPPCVSRVISALANEAASDDDDSTADLMALVASQCALSEETAWNYAGKAMAFHLRRRAKDAASAAEARLVLRAVPTRLREAFAALRARGEHSGPLRDVVERLSQFDIVDAPLATPLAISQVRAARLASDLLSLHSEAQSEG